MEKNDEQKCWWWVWELSCTYQLKKRKEMRRKKERAARDVRVCVRAPGFSFLAPGASSFSGNPAIYSLSRQQFPPFLYIYTYILFYFIFFFFSLLEFLPHPIPSHFFGLSARAAMPSFSFQRYRKQPQCDQYHRGAQHWTEVSLKRSRDKGRGYGLDMHCRHSSIQLLLCCPIATLLPPNPQLVYYSRRLSVSSAMHAAFHSSPRECPGSC